MKVSEITKAEVKYTKRIFKHLDRALEFMDDKRDNISEEEFEKEIKFRISEIAYAFVKLGHYELDCEAFKKYIDNSRYIELLDRAYEHCKNTYKIRSDMRLDEDTFFYPKRKAKKLLKEWCKKTEKQHGLFARVLFSDEVERSSEELVYKFRDWLIYGIDELITMIEPARHEYIITRRGNVKEEDVDEYLLERFPEYELYSQWVTTRPYYEVVYYPDLKLD